MNGHSITNGYCHHEQNDFYELMEKAADYIKSKVSKDWPEKPSFGIICGSGLHQIGKILEESITIPYETIPGMSVSKVLGHQNSVVMGKVKGHVVVCFQGRSHYYEGNPMWKVTMPVRIMKLLGCHTLIITNCAGGINPKFKVGDIMVMKDHINFVGLAGENALRGPNNPKFGTRFPPMEYCYDKQLRSKVNQLFRKHQLTHMHQQGVYCCIGGPCYETFAEYRMLKVIGSDAVGMSTAHEVTVARHCDMKVVGLSLISDIVNTHEMEEMLNESADSDSDDINPHSTVNGSNVVKATSNGTSTVSHDQVLASAENSVQHLALIIKNLITSL